MVSVTRMPYLGWFEKSTSFGPNGSKHVIWYLLEHHINSNLIDEICNRPMTVSKCPSLADVSSSVMFL